MKLKDLKEKLNQFPEEMDDVEVLFNNAYQSCTKDGEYDLNDDFEIYSRTVVKIVNERGELFQYSFDKLTPWYRNKVEQTPEKLGWTETEETAIILS